MSFTPARIFPLGDSALTVEFGSVMSDELNAAAIRLEEMVAADPFPGFVESVPAIASTTVFYDPVIVRARSAAAVSAFLTVHDHMMGLTEKLERTSPVNDEPAIEIPVNFSPDVALDLDLIASHCGLAPGDVIDRFVSATYRVFMLGFLPGFAYLGTVEEAIAVPRKNAPRLRVPAGSVGIAGRQTGVYPLESPGGWQIIGRTDIDMLAGKAGSPCLLKPGDAVRFIPV
ncbi:MAG TPA: 5-oxoprolinase subunit PxpB [Pyrinomonadaceae bacterium]|nr:5-oxoprolinase subunit PxpB [Pyrinomonadaceae bacterium]